MYFIDSKQLNQILIKDNFCIKTQMNCSLRMVMPILQGKTKTVLNVSNNITLFETTKRSFFNWIKMEIDNLVSLHCFIITKIFLFHSWTSTDYKTDS